MTDPLTIDAVLIALGLAVLRVLWQGALIGLIAFAALALLRRADPRARYAVSAGALALCAVSFVASFAGALATPALMADAALATVSADALRAPNDPNPAPLVIAWLWLGGVCFFSVRFALQWLATLRVRTRGVAAPPHAALALFEALKRELRTASPIRLQRSNLAASPMVAGWLRPVVLVPASCFVSLSPEQLRAVLAHELAHVKRFDHWANAAQAVIETILFFHPVVWWLSSRVRLEREHCCDDIAVRLAGDPAALAGALATLEHCRLTHTPAALAANGGPLMTRIQRILGTRPDATARAPRWRTAMALAAGAVVSVAGIAGAVAGDAPTTAETTVELLRSAVETGAMTADEARSIYDVVVRPNSEHDEKMRAELDRMRVHIHNELAAGTITAQQAEEKIASLDAALAQRAATEFNIDVLGMNKHEAHMIVVRAELDRLVAEGTITREDADRRLSDLHQSVNRRVRVHTHIEEVEAEIHAAVEAGKLTPEEAHDKLRALRDRAEAREWLGEALAEVKAALEAGLITQEEADRKVEMLHEKHAHTVREHLPHTHDDGAHTRRAVRVSEIAQEDLRAIHEDIKRALHEGSITRAQADEMLAHIHKAVVIRETR